MTSRKTRTAIAVLTALLVVRVVFPAASAASDAIVRSAIFAEQHVEGTALHTHRQAVALSAEARFAFLSDWVLPGAQHSTLRVQIAFSPTNPAPPVVPAITASVGALLTTADQRQTSGGQIVSPVFDLIDTAAALGKLDELREQVSAWTPQDDPAGDRNRAATLTLIEIVREDFDAALQRLEQLLQLRSTPDTVPAAGAGPTPPSAAELLVLQRGFGIPELHALMAEMIASFRPWVISNFDRPIPHRHVSGFVARLLLEQESRTSEDEPLRLLSQSPLAQWHSASRSTAQTRGVGQPPADWLWRPGFVGNVDSHADDYLIFNTPLRGDYEVECDVTGFEWRDSHLFVAGNWVAPVYTHRHFDIGSYRSARPRTAFDPPLTKTRTWIHYRTVVRDGTATTHFNGRPVHSESLPDNPCPWVAIRSTQQHDGAVRNLRITGTPDIPAELQLSAANQLGDWIPYYEGVESAVNQPLWYVAPRGGPDNEITGLGTAPGETVTPTDGEITAGTQESLLRYFRPMVEDGTIEYEFYYVPGQLHAHPALDRLAFLLLPDGVRIHWITDGPFDRTELAADNVTDEPAHRRGPATLPLKTDDWNNLQLTVKDDTVTLTLNGQPIYERPLEATNQRTFGLFHFADWSTLLVRRVVWRGDWPRELPPLTNQELTTPEAEFLDDDLDRLAATFEHDFTRDGLPLNRFTGIRGSVGADLKPTPDGLLAARDGTGGYQHATVAPALSIIGDFDVTAEYDQLEGETAVEGTIMLALMAILDNATLDEFTVTRRYHSRSATRVDHVGQCIAVARLPGGARRNYLLTEPMEEHSGRFRLARRGDQLYFLTAEHDSPHFRLRYQKTIATDPVALDGLRLLTQIHGDGGHVSVLWKHLSIRAAGLQGRALTGVNTTVAELNAQRDKLPARLTHDFRTQEPTDELFYRWGDVARWQASPAGWLIAANGTDNWTSSGVSVQSQIDGDFDVTLRFKPESLAIPKPGQHSQAYLQMEFADKDRTTVGAIFTQEANGETAALTQVRERNADGSLNYRVIGQIAVGEASSLRIARRGTSITFLAAGSMTADDQIIAEYELPEAPIERRNLRFILHTGGANRVSQARWQSIDIRATKIDGDSGTKKAQPPPNSLLDRVIDFFK